MLLAVNTQVESSNISWAFNIPLCHSNRHSQPPSLKAVTFWTGVLFYLMERECNLGRPICAGFDVPSVDDNDSRVWWNRQLCELYKIHGLPTHGNIHITPLALLLGPTQSKLSVARSTYLRDTYTLVYLLTKSEENWSWNQVCQRKETRNSVIPILTAEEWGITEWKLS